MSNYILSLLSFTIAVFLISSTLLSETNHMLSTNQLNLVSTTLIYQKKPLICTQYINARVDILNSFIKKKYKKNWLQGYMN